MTNTTIEYSRRKSTGFGMVVRDLYMGMKRYPVWLAFSWEEIKNRYRRSLIGVAWILLSYLIFVFVIFVFFRGFSPSEDGFFLLYVAIGFAAYSFIVSNLNEGAAVFLGARSWIQSTPLPLSIYVYKSVMRSAFAFCFQLAGAAVVMVVAGWPMTYWALLTIPALAVLLLTAVSVQLGLGLVAARFRDVAFFVQAISRLLLFITPILWVFEERGGRVKLIANFNPLTHYLEIFRAPLLGQPPDATSWIIVLALTCTFWVLAILAGSLLMRRISYLV